MKNLKLILILLVGIAMVSSCGGDMGSSSKTENGYDYKIFNDVSGAVAVPNQYVYFMFDIKDSKGEILQSYRNAPTTPSLKLPAKDDQAYKANPLMALLSRCSVGDSASIYIPVDSLQGVPPGYGPEEVFEYNVVVEEVLDEAAHQAKQTEIQQAAQEKAIALKAKEKDIAAFTASSLQAYKSGKATDIIELDESLKYVIHELGEGEPAKEGKYVSMQYYGMTMEGNMFDNSFKRGTAFTFTPGRGEVIKGWDRVIPLLKEGAKASIFIPAALAYGAAGSPPSIPPNADLMFYVEVEKVFN